MGNGYKTGLQKKSVVRSVEGLTVGWVARRGMHFALHPKCEFEPIKSQILLQRPISMVDKSASGQLDAEHDLQDQLTDLWEIIHRHLGLASACLLIMLGLGGLYYLKAPRTYESETDILIVSKQNAGFSKSDEERPMFEKSVETHALMVQSKLIVEKALKEYDLVNLPTLVGEEDPVAFVIENLNVSLKDDNATVLNVAFRCGSPEDSRDIVSSIANTYESYLGNTNQQGGQKASTLIQKGQQILQDEMKAVQEEYRKFQRQANLMYRDGQGVNMHHERQAAIEASRQELMVQRAILEAKIQSLEMALAEGGVSREAVRLEALSELKPNTGGSDYWKVKLAEQEQFASREVIHQSASILMQEYIRLKVEKSELQSEFDAGHPRVKSASKRLNEVSRMLSAVMNQDLLSVSGVMEDIELEKDKDYVGIYLQWLRDRLAIFDTQIAQLDAEFQAEQKLANEMQDILLRDQEFRSRVDLTTKLFDEVVSSLKEINLVQEHGGDTVSIIAAAQLGEQVAPRIAYVGVASTFLGCLFGSVLCWLVDRSENTFRSAVEVRNTLKVPVIGRIPVIKKRDQIVSATLPHIAPIVCTVHQDKSQVAEAFRAVRTNLYFSTSAGVNAKVLQITSPLPGDGKSTVTANLAVAMAKSGKRVLVMDADFRKPSMAKLLGKPKNCKHGLAAVIAGQADPVDSALATEIPNLFFLPAHERPLNPSELLSTPQFKSLLDLLRDRFDIILIDTPPLLAVSDPCVVAARVDGVLLTLRIRKGVQQCASRAMEMLRGVDAKVLGTIINSMDDEQGFDGTTGAYGKYAENYTDSPTIASRPKANLRQPQLRR